MSTIVNGWVRPTAWENLSQDQLEHAVRNGWARNVAQVVEQIYAAGLMASYYAWGRLDQGATCPLPVYDADHRTLSATDAVLAFKVLFERAKRDEFAGASMHTPSVQDAWENFVTSRGTSIRP